MSKFLKRTIVSVLLVAFVLAVIYSFPIWLFCVVVVMFIAGGQFEFFRLVEHRGVFVYKYFGTIVGALIPIVIFMGATLSGLNNLETLVIVLAGLFAFTLQLIRKDSAKDHLVSMAITIFSIFYIAWFFSFFIKLRCLPGGSNLVAFLIMVTKGADIGAYLIGGRFGRHELIPRISPKKTREGTLGGIAVSVILSMTVGRSLTGFSFAHLSILGLLLAILGQIGDLAESLIKRDCSVKDSGPYFSAIGGVLDLIDSLLFTAPVFYFYVSTL